MDSYQPGAAPQHQTRLYSRRALRYAFSHDQDRWLHRALQTVTDELAAEGADPASIVAALTEVAVKPRGRAGNMARPAWRPPGAVLLAAGQSVRDGELAKVFWESLADCWLQRFP